MAYIKVEEDLIKEVISDKNKKNKDKFCMSCAR